MYLLDVDTSLKSLCPTHSATRYARPARSATPIVRLRGGSRNSPKLKSHQWLSATLSWRPKHETGSPYVPYFEIPSYGEAVTTKEPIANFALHQSQTQKNIQSGGKNALSQSFQTQFSARTSVTRPLRTRRIAAYRVRSHPRTCSFPRSPPRRPRCSPPSRPATPRRPPTFAEEVPTIISEGMFSASRPPSRSPGPSAARAG